MFDVEVREVGGTRALLRVAQALGDAGVGLEGGGFWAGEAHYLVEDGGRAASALAAAGIGHVTVRDAILAELDADVPGALARLLTRLDAQGVTLVAQYSDHGNRKVLVLGEEGS